MQTNDDNELESTPTDGQADDLSTDQYDAVGEVVASTYRQTALEELADAPATPSTLETRTGHGIAHISRALQQLRDLGLVELLVSEDRRKGRIYGLTDAGEATLNAMAEMGMVEGEA